MKSSFTSRGVVIIVFIMTGLYSICIWSLSLRFSTIYLFQHILQFRQTRLNRFDILENVLAALYLWWHIHTDHKFILIIQIKWSREFFNIIFFLFSNFIYVLFWFGETKMKNMMTFCLIFFYIFLSFHFLYRIKFNMCEILKYHMDALLVYKM